MSYNSSFTGQQADAALQKAAVIQMDGEGTQFLGNDGVYHDISSLPTISFSLFPSDSGTLSAENLQTYLSVAANGVAIVLGGVDANAKPSGIANFMDMGEEMYMSYGYSSFFREIDGTENGKGTVDSAAVVVSVNKTTGAYLKSVTNVRLLNNGDGDMFLADDGTYKEAGDKTNVLILSLENDLANGQKDSSVTAEVSASLVDAITTGKACVIKSANSDILANLQQIGNNVTIIMEQISRVGQTFVAVNTSITVNTSTNVIADYQTGAIVLETSGDGSKFLADDGTYKAVSGGDNMISQSDQNAILDAINSITNSELTSGGTLSEEKYNAIVSATPEAIKTLGGNSNGVYIRYDRFGKSTPASGMVALSGIYTYNDGAISFMSRDLYTGLYLGVIGYNSAQFANLSITSSRQISYSLKNIQFDSSSDGTKFLADNGQYKEIPAMKILTESEYAALGTTPETDGVLYFVTPD